MFDRSLRVLSDVHATQNLFKKNNCMSFGYECEPTTKSIVSNVNIYSLAFSRNCSCKRKCVFFVTYDKPNQTDQNKSMYERELLITANFKCRYVSGFMTVIL